MKLPKFDRGDIVWVNLNPAAGRELQGEKRPVLILSTAVFNALGVALVAPISQGANMARCAGFAVPLNGSGCDTQGVALFSQARMLDLDARNAKKIETAPDFVIEDAIARFQTILD